jgi:hypothetical protein
MRNEIIPLIISLGLFSAELMAGDEVDLSLIEESGGISIGIESHSIYNLELDLPIVISAGKKDRGLFLTFIDSGGKSHSLCAQVDFSDIPRKSRLYFKHKVSVHESFSVLKKLYCLASGEYVVHGSYRGVYLDNELSTIESKVVSVHIR